MKMMVVHITQMLHLGTDGSSQDIAQRKALAKILADNLLPTELSIESVQLPETKSVDSKEALDPVGQLCFPFDESKTNFETITKEAVFHHLLNVCPEETKERYNREQIDFLKTRYGKSIYTTGDGRYQTISIIKLVRTQIIFAKQGLEKLLVNLNHSHDEFSTSLCRDIFTMS